jgi:transposase
MDQVMVVRHKVLVEKESARRVARELGISRVTIRRYLEGAPIGERRRSERPSPVTDGIRGRVDAILLDSPRWTAGKQRLTAARVHRMLRDEGVRVGEWVVKRLVREWRRKRQEVFVPLVYRPGDLAEVDFFEVLVDIAGERRKAWMFVMRLMHSGRDFAWLYPRQDQVCFLDGHVRAFAHFGGVPHRIAYDNLRAAVAKMLAGSERMLAPRFAALATHYLFEPCFARPRTGHDKGGVEARGKGIRWQELVPIPSGDTLDAVSSALVSRLDARAQHAPIVERLVDEAAALLPLPSTSFEPAILRCAPVSRSALVKLGGAHYSVWSEWVRLEVRAYVGVTQVVLVGPDGRRVEHPRQPFGGRSIDYRHYLPELAKKPQAVRQVAPELVGALGAPYDALWRLLVDERGPKDAARVLAKVLAQIVERGDLAVRDVVTRALAAGEPVLIALRPVAATAGRLPSIPSTMAAVEITASDAAEYDRLLRGEA